MALTAAERMHAVRARRRTAADLEQEVAGASDAPTAAEPGTAKPVTVLFFAAAREAAGRGRLEVAPTPGLTAGAVWERLAAEHPALAPLSASISVAVNHRFRPKDTPLEPGDELAFLPPVSGG